MILAVHRTQLSQHEISILRAICAAGGEYHSIFKLSIELDICYESCWTCVFRLACRGLLVAERSSVTGRGRGYILSIPCGGSCLCSQHSIARKIGLDGVSVCKKTGIRKAERDLEHALAVVQ